MRKQGRPPIYLDSPLPLDSAVEIEPFRPIRSEVHYRWRSDIAHVVAEIHEKDLWHLAIITYSQGEANSLCSAISRGQFGPDFDSAYEETENRNNNGEEDQYVHLVFIRRNR